MPEEETSMLAESDWWSWEICAKELLLLSTCAHLMYYSSCEALCFKALADGTALSFEFDLLFNVYKVNSLLLIVNDEEVFSKALCLNWYFPDLVSWQVCKAISAHVRAPYQTKTEDALWTTVVTFWTTWGGMDRCVSDKLDENPWLITFC